MFKKIFFFLVFFIALPSITFAASASIQYLSTSTTVAVNDQVFFRISNSGFTGVITYTVSDTFSGSSVANSNVDSYGAFVWSPRTQDIGTHNITVRLSDGSGNTASVTQTVTVPTIPTVTIQSLFPGNSVNVGQTVFFSTFATGFTNPTFSASDSVYTSSMTSTNMNSVGGFSWTPRSFDVGSHTITVAVSDNAGHSANAVQVITVGEATTTITSLSPGDTIASRQNVTFKVVPTGFTNPMFTVSDSILGSSISNGNIDGQGKFNWAHTTNDLGIHLVTVRVSDSSGNVSTISKQITVTNPTITIQSLNPGNNLNVGTGISFTATTTGLTVPHYIITDSLSGTSLSNNNISTSGIFSWTPQGMDVGLHTIKITAIDNFGSSANTSVNITISSQGNTTTTTNTSTNTNTATHPNTSPSISTGVVGGGSIKYTFRRALSVGASGADVTALQTILKQQGFLSGEITGYYGNLTEKAVKDFQASKNLETLGAVGPGTRTALNNLLGVGTSTSTSTSTNTGTTTSTSTSTSTKTPTGQKFIFTKPMTIGDSNNEVTELQKKLTSLGLYSGPITGSFGPLTRAAVIKLQIKYNLEQVGSIGPGTRKVLNEN